MGQPTGERVGNEDYVYSAGGGQQDVRRKINRVDQKNS